MRKIKILFVSLNAVELATSSNMRNVALVNGLLLLGHDVEYLTTEAYSNSKHNSNLNFVKPVYISRLSNNKVYEKAVQNKENINRNKNSIKGYLFLIFRWLYHKFKIFGNSYKIAKKIDCNSVSNKEYDLIISSSDPKSSHIAVKQLIKKGISYGKWIQYWGDPLAMDITLDSLWPRWYFKKLEKMIISKADKIVYVSPFTYRSQQEIYPDFAKKMKFIPTAYIHEKRTEINNYENKNQKFKIGYFGAYPTKIRNILPLYNVCEMLKQKVNLHIVGSSDIVLEEKENIVIEQRQETIVIEQYESKCDLLVCIMNNSGTQIPGKIYHSAATDKPILVILDGENADEIGEYLSKFNRFILCKNNEEDIHKALLKIMASDRRWEPSSEFAPENIARRLLNC